MSLLDEAKAETARTNRPTCQVATLDDDLRSELEAALADETITAAGIERALSNRGVKIKATTLRRHARRDCSCESR